MILVRLQNSKKPEIILEGKEEDLIKKIHELNLCDWHDAFFYERGKFENLGLWEDEYDYYQIYTSEESMGRTIK